MSATPVQIVDAVVKYIYNVNPSKVFDEVYGSGHCQSYRCEKIDKMKNLSCWWGELDNECRAKLINAALTHYGLM